MKCTGKKISLVFLHRNKFVHWVSLPGILVPVSKFPVHVPVQNKYARIPVPANYPGTGSAQPLAHKLRDRHLLKSLCVSKEKTFIALQLEIVCRCLEFKGGVELCEVCASCNISSDWIFEEKQAFSLAERGSGGCWGGWKFSVTICGLCSHR